jgi:hypothetical protein
MISLEQLMSHVEDLSCYFMKQHSKLMMVLIDVNALILRNSRQGDLFLFDV